MYVKAQYCRNAGLGNKLFPWARAIITADLYKYKMIDPVWFSPRGAAITRGGIDYKKAIRKIWLCGNFKKRKQDIPFLQGLFIGNDKFQSCDNLEQVGGLINKDKRSNIIFRWNACHTFSDLSSHRILIKKALEDITMTGSLAFAEKYNDKQFIGLNIRTGKDFIKAGPGRKGYFLTDIAWFIQALKLIRLREGDLPAIIVSDGGSKELKEILKEPGTSLLQSGNAIEDLLVLSKSRILLGSGNSSFSAWASFLGAMDTFSSPDTSFAHFNIQSDNKSQLVETL